MGIKKGNKKRDSYKKGPKLQRKMLYNYSNYGYERGVKPNVTKILTTKKKITSERNLGDKKTIKK